MSENTLPNYLTFSSALQSASLAVNPAELHGLLVGMLAGGLNANDKSWQTLLFDYTNEGMGWPAGVMALTEQVWAVSAQELTGSNLELNLMLPEEDEATVFELADSVADWVNHFISGLGLANVALNKAADDVKEAFADLEEMARLGIDEEDDLEEQALLLEQVIEHIKACVLTVHAEFGVKPEQEEQPTIH